MGDPHPANVHALKMGEDKKRRGEKWSSPELRGLDLNPTLAWPSPCSLSLTTLVCTVRMYKMYLAF